MLDQALKYNLNHINSINDVIDMSMIRVISTSGLKAPK